MAACISVRITCLKRTYYLLDLRKRVCQNSHTSAYAGATRCSVTGPLGIIQEHVLKAPYSSKIDIFFFFFFFFFFIFYPFAQEMNLS